jgi:hypothetical protein
MDDLAKVIDDDQWAEAQVQEARVDSPPVPTPVFSENGTSGEAAEMAERVLLAIQVAVALGGSARLSSDEAALLALRVANS